MAIQPGTRPMPVPLPRRWGIRQTDVVALLVGNGVFIVLLWVRHGGLDQLGTTAGALTAAGQLTALLGTYLALIQLVLMGRSPWLDEAFGMDRLAVAHRWLGFATVWLIAAHGVLTTTGYAMGDGAGVVDELAMLLTTYPYVLWATAGFGLFVLVGVSSVRAARRRLSYETWYGLHLYAYLAIALAFLHQLFVGADFMHDQLAAIYWIGLYVVTAALVLTFRVGQPLVTSVRHRLRVSAIVDGGGGRRLRLPDGRRPRPPRRAVRPVLRDPVPHPRRMVARPPVLDLLRPERPLAPLHGQGPGRRQPADRRDPGRDAGVRRGPVRHAHRRPPDAARRDADRRRHRDHAAPGAARVAAGRARRPHADLPRDDPPTSSCSGRSSTRWPRTAARRSTTSSDRGARGSPGDRWPARRSTPPRWRGWCPTIAEQDVYLCGPTGLMDAVRGALDELGVPRRHVHLEQFAY